nr:hypothetical protein BCU62_15500 [Enterovibrio norvegicus]
MESEFRFHPLIRLLNRQDEIGLALVMDHKHHNSPLTIKKLSEILDDGSLSSSELESLCNQVLGRLKLI